MRPWAIIRVVLAVVFSWYASLAVHEAGHALAGTLAEAESIEIRFPLLGFSQTRLTGNGHPLFTTATGPAVGTVLPLAFWLVWDRARWPGRRLLRMWAGFALVLNGGYLAGDAILQGGDGGELIRAGAPAWPLVVVGAIGVAAGLWVWHTMGLAHSAGPDAQRTA